MNKRFLKYYLEDRKKEVEKLHSDYTRMNEFYRISCKHFHSWTFEEQQCFWSWYYNSKISAEKALDKLKE